jgi:hypothetical protein
MGVNSIHGESCHCEERAENGVESGEPYLRVFPARRGKGKAKQARCVRR